MRSSRAARSGPTRAPTGGSGASPRARPSSRAMPTRSANRFADIERWLTENFEAGPIEYRWINEDYAPMDGAPFIGWSSNVATAIWSRPASTPGGSATARRRRDHRRPRHRQGQSLARAVRRDPGQAGRRRQRFREGESVRRRASGRRLSGAARPDPMTSSGPARRRSSRSTATMSPPSGREGALHAVSAVCTHMGCLVGWNADRPDLGLPLPRLALRAERRGDPRPGDAAAGIEDHRLAETVCRLPIRHPTEQKAGPDHAAVFMDPRIQARVTAGN